MTDELGREELIRLLKDSFGDNKLDLQAFQYDFPQEEFNNRMEKLNKAEEQIKALIQKPGEIKAEPGGLKPGEYMHEWLEKDAVLLDLPSEEIIEALARDNKLLKDKLEQKPGVTEEWIEEKAKELCEQNYVNDEAKDFIRSLVGEIHGRK